MPQPYLHESRHLHAKRRERGCGGRFINKKKPDIAAASNVPDTHTSSYETVLRNVNSSSSSGSRPFNFFRESDSPRSNGEATEPLHQTHPNQTYSSSGCNLQFPGCHVSKFHSLSENMKGKGIATRTNYGEWGKGSVSSIATCMKAHLAGKVLWILPHS